MQPWHTPFPIWNQSVVPCRVLTVASWQAQWQYTALMYSFPYLEPVCCSMSSSNCCFLTCIQISQGAGQVVLYSHLLKNFPVCCDPHSQRLWHSQKAEIDVFLELSCFFDDSKMLAIGSLVPLPFLNPAWTSESSRTVEAWLGEFWALLCKHVRWVQLCGSLIILWHCLSLELEWKLIFSSPVATAEFSKFAGIWMQHFHSIIF